MEVDERAVQNELARAGKLFQSDVERWLRQFRLRRDPELLSSQPLKIRIFGVIGADPLEHGRRERGPTLAGHDDF